MYLFPVYIPGGGLVPTPVQVFAFIFWHSCPQHTMYIYVCVPILKINPNIPQLNSMRFVPTSGKQICQNIQGFTFADCQALGFRDVSSHSKKKI